MLLPSRGCVTVTELCAYSHTTLVEGRQDASLVQSRVAKTAEKQQKKKTPTTNCKITVAAGWQGRARGGAGSRPGHRSLGVFTEFCVIRLGLLYSSERVPTLLT